MAYKTRMATRMKRAANIAPVMAAILIVLDNFAAGEPPATTVVGSAAILYDDEDGNSLLLIADSGVEEENESGRKVLVVDIREAWLPDRKMIVEETPMVFDDDWKARGLLTDSGEGVPAGE